MELPVPKTRKAPSPQGHIGPSPRMGRRAYRAAPAGRFIFSCRALILMPGAQGEIPDTAAALCIDGTFLTHIIRCMHQRMGAWDALLNFLAEPAALALERD